MRFKSAGFARLTLVTVTYAIGTCMLLVLVESQGWAQPIESAASPSTPANPAAKCWPSSQPVCPSELRNGGATALVVQQPAASPLEDGKLKASIPLLQSLAWAILIGAALLGFRKQIGRLIDRIKSVKVGTDGIEVETPPEELAQPSSALPENTNMVVLFEQ